LLAEKMAFNIGGSGEVHCPQADFGVLSISISGNGEVELGGKANDLTIRYRWKWRCKRQSVDNQHLKGQHLRDLGPSKPM
jgi:hypothetical protein